MNNGLLDILYNQSNFDRYTIQWNEMFNLRVNNTGQSNVGQRDAIQRKIKEMDRFKEAYVGDNYSTVDVDSITVIKLTSLWIISEYSIGITTPEI